jgi:hypothetical protein
MRSLVKRRPSPAMVVASTALFVSLGGVSYGLATGSIGSREIRNNSIRSVDVRNRSLLASDFKTGQLPAGPQGEQGPRGPSDAISLENVGTGDLPSTAGPSIARLTLAPGAYIVIARLVINGASAASYRGDCELQAGQLTDKASVSDVAPSGVEGSTPVTLVVPAQLSAAGEAILACTDSGAQPATFSNARITAIHVDKVFAIAATA